MSAAVPSISTQNEVDQKTREEEQKFVVKYKQKFYDITEFLRKHPGGIGTLKGLQNGDMTARFMKAPPHSDAAMYLLKEYQIKDEGANRAKNGKKGNPMSKYMENGIELIAEEDKNNNQLDESMEVSEKTVIKFV